MRHQIAAGGNEILQPRLGVATNHIVGRRAPHDAVLDRKGPGQRIADIAGNAGELRFQHQDAERRAVDRLAAGFDHSARLSQFALQIIAPVDAITAPCNGPATGSPLGDRMSNALNGADAMVRMLEAHGVRHIFGLCGDTSLPLYDSLLRLDHGITHILTRDERSAAYMADAYARVTGRPGVCEGPSGGGATYITARVDRGVGIKLRGSWHHQRCLGGELREIIR